jgi:hypothetical protein
MGGGFRHTMTMMASPAKRGEYVCRQIAGEAIVVPIRGQMADLEAIYNLNETAAFIWGRIDGATSVDQIVEAVCGEFEATPEKAREDTLEFLGGLEQAGLIEAG